MPEQPIHVLEMDKPFRPPGTPQAEADEATRRLYEEAHRSVVRIEVDGSPNGTGFAFDRPGLIATDWHVVNRGKEFHVVTSDGKSYKARIKDIDELRDLAILQLEGVPPESLRPLQAGDVSRLRKDDKVTGLGHPERSVPVYISPGQFVASLSYGRFRELTKADLSGPLPPAKSPADRADIDTALNRTLLLGHVHARHGNSGGPLLDASGKVIGVADLTGNPATYSQTLYTPVTDLTALVNRPQPKFEFKYEYKGSPLTQEYMGLMSQNPLLTGLGTAGVGYLGYRGFNNLSAVGRSSNIFIPAIGISAGMQLWDDAPRAWNANNNRDLLKYSTASLADTGMIAGTAMRYFSKPILSSAPSVVAGIEGRALTAGLSKTGKIGMGILAGAMILRVAAEFIPNHLTQTEIIRTDGTGRPPIPIYLPPP